MAKAVLEAASQVPGKEALAMEAYARALLSIPSTISDNAGYDSAQLISELKAGHAQGHSTYGLDMEEGKVDCMDKVGITESFQVKRQMMISAAEAAEMILRVDDILRAAPRQRSNDQGYC